MNRIKFILSILLLIPVFNSFAQDYCSGERFNNFIFPASQTEVISDIQYGLAVNQHGNLEELFLDVYRPKPDADELELKPCIFFVHGGGLVGGSKESEGAADLGSLYAQLGFVFVSINYRLGWESGTEGGCDGDTADLFRAEYRGVQDTKAAYRFIKANAAIYGIDTNFIFAEGNSAGSNLLLWASYAEQSDFDAQYYDELGSIDSSSFDFYNHSFDPKGLIFEAAGVEDTTILYNKNYPTFYFHGTCDSIVPYFSGPTFSCYEPVTYPTLFGSFEQVRIFNELHKTYHLYTGEGAGHDVAPPDTIVDYAKEFLKDILCEEAVSEDIYRVLGKSKCAVANNGDLYIQPVFPNPVSDIITIEVSSTRNRDVDLWIYNALGQEVKTQTFDFYPPVKTYTIDVSNYPTGIYFMVVSQRQEIYVLKFVK